MSGQHPDYKTTLNLPKTAFPMRGGLAKLEPKVLERWESEGLYRAITARREGAPRFLLHDGPPYANGHIHHGHILNKVLKDFVVKYKTMAGFHAPYVPGWDCHGLPIEHKVDQELGDRKRDMSQVEIRKACRAYADRFVGIQRDGFKRLGVLGQWDDPYTTMSYQYESRTVEELARFMASGAVYKGLKPVHWSWAAQTALADAEVEYDVHKAPSIYVKFAFPDPPAFIREAVGDASVHVVIWTTTPWTLPANLAIALNPDYDYQLVRINAPDSPHHGDVLVLAEGLRAQTLAACKLGDEAGEVVGAFKGEQLVGRTPEDAPRPVAKHPFLGRDSVLLPAPYVTLEQGTGCVHTAPGHGQEDFQLGQEFGLDVLNPVDTRGRYTRQFADLEGTHVFKANPKIIEVLVERGVLLSPPKLTVKIERYPHCWRTKTPVIFRATEQWFISMDTPLEGHGRTLREMALEAIDQVQWIPSWGKDRILGMMEHRPDWCISRQRLWGVPIPVLYCDATDTTILSAEVAHHVAKLVAEHGADVWFDRPVEDLVPEGFTWPGVDTDPSTWRKEVDILDVWFDSGSSWSAVLGAKMGVEEEVADLYLEGSDQHRGWFNSSLLIGLGTRAKAPYKAVLTHGFVLDNKGRKYSKSSKNFVAPDKMIQQDGAEILRLWVAAVDYRGDMSLSPEIIKTVKDGYRKIRNTCRFLLGNVADFNPETDAVAPEALGPIDVWALGKLQQLIRKLRGAYDAYEFHTIYHELVRYTTVDLSNLILHTSKDVLYANAPDSPARRATQTVLYAILRALVRLMAPILSFTSEEVWGYMNHRADDPASVHLADLPEPDASLEDAERDALWETLLGVKTEVDRHIDALRPKKRGEQKPGQIKVSEQAEVQVTAQGPTLAALQTHAETLSKLFVVSSVELVDGDPGPEPEGQRRAAPVAVQVTATERNKCPRCWRYLPEVQPEADHPLCGRCTDVIAQRIDVTGAG